MYANIALEKYTKVHLSPEKPWNLMFFSPEQS